MKPLEELRRQMAAGQFDFSRHAFRRAVERNIADQEIREAGAGADIIENYPEDKYAPIALLLGFTAAGRPLHLQVSLFPSEHVRIVTLYEPDPAEWIDFHIRRS